MLASVAGEVAIVAVGGFRLSSGSLQLMSSVDTGQNSWWVEVRNPSTNSGFSFHAIVR